MDYGSRIREASMVEGIAAAPAKQRRQNRLTVSDLWTITWCRDPEGNPKWPKPIIYAICGTETQQRPQLGYAK